MRDRKIYIVAYDISENKKRTRITKILSDHGIRIQKSVFRCLLSKEQKDNLIYKLKYLINQYQDNDDSDSLLLFEEIKEEHIKVIEGDKNFIKEEKTYHIV